MGQREGAEYRAGQYDVNQQRGQQLGALASLTRPQLFQSRQYGGSEGGGQSQSTTDTTGTTLSETLGESMGSMYGQQEGSMTGTTNMTGKGNIIQPSNFWSNLLGGGLAAATSFI